MLLKSTGARECGPHIFPNQTNLIEPMKSKLFAAGKGLLQVLGAIYILGLIATAFVSCSSTDLQNVLKHPTVKAVGKIATNTALNLAATRIKTDDPLVAQALSDIITELAAVNFGGEGVLVDHPDIGEDGAQLLADLQATIEAAETQDQRDKAVAAVLDGLKGSALTSSK